jgi:hypothetical protein
MTIQYTLDVFCNTCGYWEHGITSHNYNRKTEARDNVGRMYKYIYYKGKDYCPKCWEKMKNANP